VLGYLLIALGVVICSLGAISAKRLLISALWLAGASALVALLIYILGAPQVAVIELSVGAGLVTVLFVFAINIAGEEQLPSSPVVPKGLSLGMVALALLLIAWFVVKGSGLIIPSLVQSDFVTELWNNRSLDVLLQIALIFSGVLGVLGLLSDLPHSDLGRKEPHP
jgi:uncharacterized MnhB-related membrane protein